MAPCRAAVCLASDYRSQAGLSVSGEPKYSPASPESREYTFMMGTSTLSISKVVASDSEPPSQPLPLHPS